MSLVVFPQWGLLYPTTISPSPGGGGNNGGAEVSPFYVIYMNQGTVHCLNGTPTDLSGYYITQGNAYSGPIGPMGRETIAGRSPWEIVPDDVTSLWPDDSTLTRSFQLGPIFTTSSTWSLAGYFENTPDGIDALCMVTNADLTHFATVGIGGGKAKARAVSPANQMAHYNGSTTISTFTGYTFVSLCCDGTNYYAFINGQAPQSLSAFQDNSPITIPSSHIFNIQINSPGLGGAYGSFDQILFHPTECLWTTPYTPPTAPFYIP